MKSTVENTEPTHVRLTVTVDHEELKPNMDKAYRGISEQVQVPGFRKGHVPPRIIDQRFGRAAVIEQAVNDVLPSMYAQAISENNLRPMAQPELEVTEIPSTTGPFEGQVVFTAEVEVIPPFELPTLDESVVIEVDPSEVSDDDVNEELDKLRGRFATLKPIKRQAKTGDFATIDMTATVNGEVVDTVSDVSYEIGSGSMLAGQDTALRGTHAGDDVQFTSKLKGGDHEGEEAEVSLHVQALKARELPAADDDFAQMVSEFDTIDELLADLREQAGAGKRNQQALQARDRLVDHIIEATDIQLPSAVVDHEVEHRVGADATAKQKKDAQDTVERQMREEVISEDLAKAGDVKVSQQELLDYIFQMSQVMGLDINQVFQDTAQIQQMATQLGRTKALIQALRQVTVKDTSGTDVDLSEFFGDQQGDAEGAETETPAETETETVSDDAAETSENGEEAQTDGQK